MPKVLLPVAFAVCKFMFLLLLTWKAVAYCALASSYAFWHSARDTPCQAVTSWGTAPAMNGAVHDTDTNIRHTINEQPGVNASSSNKHRTRTLDLRLEGGGGDGALTVVDGVHISNGQASHDIATDKRAANRHGPCLALDQADEFLHVLKQQCNTACDSNKVTRMHCCKYTLHSASCGDYPSRPI